MSSPFVKYEDIKSLLGLDKDSLSDYPALEVIFKSVQAALEGHSGRILAEAEATKASGYEIFATQMLYLPALPIVSVTKVSVDGIEVTDYKITPYGLRLGVSVAEVSWEIEYTGGFEEIPPELYRAGLLQTAYEYQNKEHIGATNVSTDGGMVSTPALGLLAEVKRLLAPFIHISRIN